MVAQRHRLARGPTYGAARRSRHTEPHKIAHVRRVPGGDVPHQRKRHDVQAVPARVSLVDFRLGWSGTHALARASGCMHLPLRWMWARPNRAPMPIRNGGPLCESLIRLVRLCWYSSYSNTTNAAQCVYCDSNFTMEEGAKSIDQCASYSVFPSQIDLRCARASKGGCGATPTG